MGKLYSAIRFYSLVLENVAYLFQFLTQLAHDLLALADVDFGLRTRQFLARAGDREALFVKQVANLADQDYVLPLIVAPVAAPLDGFELWKFLLPVPQHMRFDFAEVADLADSQIALARYRREILKSRSVHCRPLRGL